MVNPPTGTSSSYWSDTNTYIGYYEAFNPDHLFADGWTKSSWRQTGIGGYGGCQTCVMIEVIWIRTTTGLCCPSGWNYDGSICMSISGEDAEPPHLCSLGGVPVEDAPAPYYPPIKQIPYERPDAPEVPPKGNGACPRGERFLASGWELITGCPEGYTRPQFGDYCVCDESPEVKGIEEYGEDNSLQGIIKMLPQLIIVMVIVSIIGAFRK